MLPKPCSSKVRDSVAITCCSTTRSAGRNSGNPLSGVGLAMSSSESSGDPAGVTGAQQVEQVGVGGALAPDRGLLAVARQDDDVVRQREHLVAERGEHL